MTVYYGRFTGRNDVLASGVAAGLASQFRPSHLSFSKNAGESG